MRTISALAFAVLVAACSAPPKPAPVSNQAPTTAPAATSAVAIGLVINGQEIWVGNEEHESESAAQYHGALNALRTAITDDAPAGVLPAGSQAVVVTYAVGATIRLPLGPIDRLTGDALGKQIDYRGKLGSDLVQGVQLGLAELAKADAPRRVLIVIGDGNDTDNEAARPALASLQQSAKAEIYAIVYKSAVSLEDNIIEALTPNVTTVNASEGFRAALADIWRRVTGG